jgi:hypothetical protein
MSEPAIVTEAVRAFCESMKERKETHKRKKAPLPNTAIVFDTETTTDASQRLTFGAYALYARDGENEWYRDEPYERGLFYADGPGAAVDVAVRVTLLRNAIDQRIVVQSQSEFLERFYELAYKQHALVVGFNIPFDIARIAREASPARRNAKRLLLSSLAEDEIWCHRARCDG